MYVTAKVAAEQLGVCRQTLRSYANKGLIDIIRTGGGQRRYNVESFKSGKPNNASNNLPKRIKPIQKTTKGALYARVSSHKQKDDLQRQIEALQEKYPQHKVYKDICSGLKFKRKALTRLLESVQEGTVDEVVVAHKDRLARFGTELIEWIINQAGARLIILDQNTLSPQEELTQDLMAIVHVFSCRLNGKRKYIQAESSRKAKKSRTVQKQISEGASNNQGTKGCHPEAEPSRGSMSVDSSGSQPSSAPHAASVV